ncbi:hypothetical protein ACFL4Q_04935, partial [candidate division KSB1 bacterium]
MIRKRIMGFIQFGCTAAVVLTAVLQSSACGQPQFRGYLENRLFATFLDNKFSPADYGDNLKWGNFNRAR